MTLSATSLAALQEAATTTLLKSISESPSPYNSPASTSRPSPQAISTFVLSITLSLLLLILGIWKSRASQARQVNSPILALYSIPDSRMFSRKESTSRITQVGRLTDPCLHYQDPRIRTTVPRGHEFISLDVGFGETQRAHRDIGQFAQRAGRTLQDIVDVIQDVGQGIGTLGGL